jgi:tRNA pseudouridine55 synthase
VLILCLGRATKLVESLMDLPKTYLASARLDVTSDSFDSDRPLIETPVASPPDASRIERALSGFVGTILQVPPAVSAIKVGGRRAYQMERAGKPPVLSPRPAQVYELTLERHAWPAITFRVRCGRGTYVRALIRDLGVALGTGGCLTGLTREAIGPFELSQTCGFSQLESGPWEPFVLAPETALELARRAPEKSPPRLG